MEAHGKEKKECAMNDISEDSTREQESIIEEKLKIQQQFEGGANWFFWIAGLSLVNTVVILVNGQWSFIIGLGITQIVDALAVGFAQEAGSGAVAIKLVALFIDLCITGTFVIFGILSRKKYQWSFIIGMIIYALDGLLFLLISDFLSLGFHVFALWGLYGGYEGCRKIKEIEKNSFSHASYQAQAATAYEERDGARLVENITISEPREKKHIS